MAPTLTREAWLGTDSSGGYMVLFDISWRTYEALLLDHLDSPWPRFVYDEGTLEIMTPSSKHDRLVHFMQRFIDVVAEEWDLDVVNVGHGTMRRAELKKGFEADASIYLQNAERVRSKDEIDLNVDPPPDLVIEVEMSRSALKKLAIYAQFGVPEVWRCDEGQVTFHILRGEAYLESSSSLVLPGVTTATLLEFVHAARQQKYVDWVRSVREWAKTHGQSSKSFPF